MSETLGKNCRFLQVRSQGIEFLFLNTGISFMFDETHKVHDYTSICLGRALVLTLQPYMSSVMLSRMTDLVFFN